MATTQDLVGNSRKTHRFFEAPEALEEKKKRNYSGHPFFQRETRYSFPPKGEGIARFAGNTDLGLSSYE